MIGETFSQYRILKKLGGGGMGVVYTAEDTRLKRTVALKFLPPELTRDDDAKERFVREAQAASALDHPNLCTIYEVDETPDGHLFIVMAFYEGETLKEKIARGPIAIDLAVRWAWQAAEGLARAHAKGIAHRDIKPANLLVTEEGEIKVLDFGLAKVAGQADLTKEGATLGTPSYMSPEQVAGEGDECGDVFSLGAVLYEMLTGKRAFPGEGTAAIFAILHREPESLEIRRPDVSPELRAVVERALAKDPEQRYPSAVETASALQDLLFPTAPTLKLPTVSSSPKKKRFSARSTVIPAIFVLLLIAAWWLRRPETAQESAQDQSSVSGEVASTDSKVAAATDSEAVAVLPFSFRGDPKMEYLAEGMVDLLSAKLDGVGELRSVDPRALLSDLERRPVQADDPAQAAEVAERFNAGRLLLGNIVEVAGQVRLDASLYSLQDDGPEVTAKASVEGDVPEIFALVDDLAGQLLSAEFNLLEIEPARTSILMTSSFPALAAYLTGESNFRRGRFAEAAESLRLAVEEDPEFALAWYRLSFVDEWLFDTESAREAAFQAARYADRLGEHQRLFVDALSAANLGDAAAAIEIYRKILTRYPENVEARFNIAELQFHCAPSRGRSFIHSRETWEQVIDLEPDNTLASLHLGRIAFYENRPDRLARELNRLRELLPGIDDSLEIVLLQTRVATGSAAKDAAAEERLRALLRARQGAQIQQWVHAGGPYVTNLAELEVVAARLNLLTDAQRPSEERAFGYRAAAVTSAVRGRFAEARRALQEAANLGAADAAELSSLLAALPFRTIDAEELERIASSAEAPTVASSGYRPHEGLEEHFALYQSGLFDVFAGRTEEALRIAERLEGLSAEGELAALGFDLAHGVRAELARRDGPESVLAETTKMRNLCSYQQGLRTPLASRVRERFLQAEALRDLGRFEEAYAIYESLPETGMFDLVYLAPSHLRRGQISARLGRADEAREHLNAALRLWEGADPEMQSLLHEARQALAESG